MNFTFLFKNFYCKNLFYNANQMSHFTLSLNHVHLYFKLYICEICQAYILFYFFIYLKSYKIFFKEYIFLNLNPIGEYIKFLNILLVDEKFSRSLSDRKTEI